MNPSERSPHGTSPHVLPTAPGAHPEVHRHDRIGWLRAAVLGANDGIVSTASLLVGIAASDATRNALLVGGFAGLSAGAFAMAAGEYVSVSSQADAEKAEIERERAEHATDPDHELAELAAIYRTRGLSPDLATQVAKQLHDHDSVGAHLRDEFGIGESAMARPVQAGAVSAASFLAGGIGPVVLAAIMPASVRISFIVAFSLLMLFSMGWLGAKLGGGSPARGAMRVLLGGGLAMALTALIGRLVGTAL